MAIGEHAPRGTTVILTDDLRRVLAETSAARRAITSNARMVKEEKIHLFSKLAAIDKIVIRNLQLSLFTPEQRSHG